MFPVRLLAVLFDYSLTKLTIDYIRQINQRWRIPSGSERRIPGRFRGAENKKRKNYLRRNQVNGKEESSQAHSWEQRSFLVQWSK